MLFLELGWKPFRDIIRERRLGFLFYILKEDPKSMIHNFFQTQLKNRTKKDWVSMVLDDLDKLDMKDTSFEEIINMKKGYFMKVVKLRNEEKVFNSLEKVGLRQREILKF